jgi:short-subunit dehydrogenase
VSDRQGLAGRAVVITGASAGIGRELALRLAGRGAKLALAARSAGALAELARACEARGARAIALETDVTQPQACRELIERSAAELGGIDVLVANAGLSMWARFDEITDLTLFERLMRVNYLGAVYPTYHALPHLRRSRGLLVAISSLTGKMGVPTRSAYAASKHAMQGFFDSLRIELRHEGVDVLVVSPGFVATGVRERALGPDGRPLGASPRDESHGTMPVEDCARAIVVAIERRRRELVLPRAARLALWLRVAAPRLFESLLARSMNDPGRSSR